MTFDNLIEQRYSLRDYSEKPVEKEKLQQIVKAGSLAPSAANRQPWRFVVVQQEEYLEGLKEAYVRPWMRSVTAIVVVVGLHDEGWKRGSDGKDHTDVDCSIAVDHMTLKATDLGLGTCWVCNFDLAKVKSVLSLADSEVPVVLLPVGYPETELNPPEKKRKPMEQTVVWL